MEIKNKTGKVIAVAAVLLLPIIVSAAATYNPIEPLPGTTISSTGDVTLSSYLEGVYKLLVGLAGVFAVLMIVIGGLQFIAGADNPSMRSAARQRIVNAIFGLFLAMGSWLILYIINPNLVGSSNIIPPISSVSTGTPPPTYYFNVKNTSTGNVYKQLFSALSTCEMVRANVASGGTPPLTTTDSSCSTL